MSEIILMGLVLGLTQVLKKTLSLNSRFIPISAIIISLGIAIAYSWVNYIPITWNIIEMSLIVALGSVGLWSGVKNTLQ